MLNVTPELCESIETGQHLPPVKSCQEHSSNHTENEAWKKRERITTLVALEIIPVPLTLLLRYGLRQPGYRAWNKPFIFLLTG